MMKLSTQRRSWIFILVISVIVVEVGFGVYTGMSDWQKRINEEAKRTADIYNNKNGINQSDEASDLDKSLSIAYNKELTASEAISAYIDLTKGTKMRNHSRNPYDDWFRYSYRELIAKADRACSVSSWVDGFFLNLIFWSKNNLSPSRINDVSSTELPFRDQVRVSQWLSYSDQITQLGADLTEGSDALYIYERFRKKMMLSMGSKNDVIIMLHRIKKYKKDRLDDSSFAS